MNRPLWICLLFTLFTLPHLGYSQVPEPKSEGGGVGTGNGGEAEIFGPIPKVRTRDGQDACHYRTAVEIFSEIPGSQETLKALEEQHWILALALRQELGRSLICLSGSLEQEPVRPDAEWRNRQGKKVRFGVERRRSTENIRIDRSLFGLADPQEKELMVLHEIGHKFFQQDLPNDTYYQSIRTFAANLVAAKKQKITEDRWSQILSSSDIPTQSGMYEYLKPLVLTLFAPQSSQLNKYQALDRLSADQLRATLRPIDQESVLNHYRTDLRAFRVALRDRLGLQIQDLLDLGLPLELSVSHPNSGAVEPSVARLLCSDSTESRKILVTVATQRAHLSHLRTPTLLCLWEAWKKAPHSEPNASQIVSLGLDGEFLAEEVQKLSKLQLSQLSHQGVELEGLKQGNLFQQAVDQDQFELWALILTHSKDRTKLLQEMRFKSDVPYLKRLLPHMISYLETEPAYEAVEALLRVYPLTDLSRLEMGNHTEDTASHYHDGSSNGGHTYQEYLRIATLIKIVKH